MAVHNLIDSKKDCGELSTNGGKNKTIHDLGQQVRMYYCLCLAIHSRGA